MGQGRVKWKGKPKGQNIDCQTSKNVDQESKQLLEAIESVVISRHLFILNETGCRCEVARTQQRRDVSGGRQEGGERVKGRRSLDIK